MRKVRGQNAWRNKRVWRERLWLSRIWHKGQRLINGAMDRVDSWRARATLQSRRAKKEGMRSMEGCSETGVSGRAKDGYHGRALCHTIWPSRPSYFTPVALATAFASAIDSMLYTLSFTVDWRAHVSVLHISVCMHWYEWYRYVHVWWIHIADTYSVWYDRR